MNKYLFLIALIVFKTTLAVEYPNIVNGIKTDKFAPVVKIYYLDELLCTGTFIEKGIILTAAHCVDGYFSGLIASSAFEKPKRVSRAESINFNLKIQDDSFDRVEDIFILPKKESSKYISSYRELLNNLADFFERNPSPDLFRNKEFHEIASFYSHTTKEFEADQKNDIALIKVKYRPYDKYYPISNAQAYEDEEVTMVGYGWDLATVEHMKLSAKKNRYNKVLSKTRSRSSIKFYSQKADEIKNEISEHLGVKKYGTNKIAKIEDYKYIIAGNYESAQTSYNNFTSYFYTWDKPDGKNVSISQGDSGSPLLKKVDGKYQVIGVASTVRDNKNISFYQKYIANDPDGFVGKLVSTYASINQDRFLQLLNLARSR